MARGSSLDFGWCSGISPSSCYQHFPAGEPVLLVRGASEAYAGETLEYPCCAGDFELKHPGKRKLLVALDKAHRHAPSGRLEDDSEANRLRSLLRRAVRETRKYGLGWFFISQTLGGLDPEILQQLRILASGFGLAIGTEFDRLRDFVGGNKRSLECTNHSVILRASRPAICRNFPSWRLVRSRHWRLQENLFSSACLRIWIDFFRQTI